MRPTFLHSARRQFATIERFRLDVGRLCARIDSRAKCTSLAVET